MEFKIKQKTLNAALSAISGCIEAKRTIPILNMVLVESLGENEIRLTATDLDVTLRTDAEAEIVKPGAVCIDGRKLVELTRALPDAEMHFIKEEKDWVRLACGTSKFRFAGGSKDHFPQTVQPSPAVTTVGSETLASLVKQTAFAVMPPKQGTSNHATYGIQTEITEAGIRLVSSDGHRLAISDADIESGHADTFVIPPKAAAELAKLDANEVGIGSDQNHLFFSAGPTLLTARKINDRFPNYQLVIPKDNPLVVGFDSGEMRDAIRRAAMMTNERLKTLSFTLSDGEMVVNSISHDEGEAEERVEVEYAGETQTFGFLWDEILQVLTVIGDGPVEMSFSGPMKPVIITPANGATSFQCILIQANVDVVKRQAAA